MYRTTNADNSALTQGSAVSGAPVETNPFVRLHNIREQLTDAVARLNGLAERITGPIPPSEGKNSLDKGVGGGLAYAVGALGDDMQNLIGAAHSAMARIDRVIP